MSAKQTKKAPMGRRYTDAEKQEVINYVTDYNATQGRGGQAAAVKKFGVAALTITAWFKAFGLDKNAAKPAAKPAAKVAAKVAKAPKPAKVAKAAKPAKVEKPAKAAKAPKPVKVAKPAKAAAPAPAKAVKAPKARKTSPQGTRYTTEEKMAVLDYVAEVNAAKGRGGMTAAAKKFKVTPLTVSSWIRKFGEPKAKNAPVKNDDRMTAIETSIAAIMAKLGM